MRLFIGLGGLLAGWPGVAAGVVVGADTNNMFAYVATGGSARSVNLLRYTENHTERVLVNSLCTPFTVKENETPIVEPR